MIKYAKFNIILFNMQLLYNRKEDYSRKILNSLKTYIHMIYSYGETSNTISIF